MKIKACKSTRKGMTCRFTCFFLCCSCYVL